MSANPKNKVILAKSLIQQLINDPEISKAFPQEIEILKDFLDDKVPLADALRTSRSIKGKIKTPAGT